MVIHKYMMKKLTYFLAIGLTALGFLFSSNAYAARSSVSIMTPRNTVHIDKDYTYGFAYLSGNALDVYETPNRKIGWKVNYEYLDKYMLRPVAVAYAAYIPVWMQDCIYNLNQNIREVNNTVNNLLVGRPVDSSISLGRFALNSTVGILGCFDVAKHIGLERKRMSFNTVLGKYGVDQGGYIVLPFYGVGTYRSIVGDTVDNLYFPIVVFPYWLDVVLWASKTIDARSRLLDQDEILTNSLDPYNQFRDFYLMYAEGLVNDGKVTNQEPEKLDENLDDYLDEINE